MKRIMNPNAETFTRAELEAQGLVVDPDGEVYDPNDSRIYADADRPAEAKRP